MKSAGRATKVAASSIQMEDLAGALDPAAAMLAEAKERLAALGIEEMETRNDFDTFKKIATAPERNILWHHFDPEKFDVPPLKDRAVWIAGKNKAGQIVHVQALRCDYLGRTSLEQQMETLLPLIGGGATDAMLPRAKEIKGNVVYHGANWIEPSLRSEQAGAWAGRYGVTIAMLLWWPDWLWGLITPYMALCGFGLRMMYPHMQPHALQWTTPPDWEDDCWLGSMSRAEAIWALKAGHAPYVQA